MEITKIAVYNNIRNRENRITEIDNDNLLRCVKLATLGNLFLILVKTTENEEVHTAGIISILSYTAYTVYKAIKNSKEINKLVAENANDKLIHTVPIAEFQGKMAYVPLLVDKNNNIYCNFNGELIDQHNFQSYIPRRISFI